MISNKIKDIIQGKYRPRDLSNVPKAGRPKPNLKYGSQTVSKKKGLALPEPDNRNRMLSAYRRFEEHGPAYKTQVLNNRTRRYGAPNYTSQNRELAYGSSARYVPLYSKTGRNIRRLKPSSYRTDRNSDLNSGRAAYRPTFTTSQHGKSKTGKYRAMTTYYRDIEANKEELDKRWRRSHSAGKNTYTNINRRYKR